MPSLLDPHHPMPEETSMQSTSLTVTASDGTPVHVFRWLPDEGVAPKGVVQIAHGMAEHAARYARFGEVLTAAGYAVYASDTETTARPRATSPRPASSPTGTAG